MIWLSREKLEQNEQVMEKDGRQKAACICQLPKSLFRAHIP